MLKDLKYSKEADKFADFFMSNGPEEDEENSPQSEYLREQSPALPHYDINLLKDAVNILDADPDGRRNTLMLQMQPTEPN